MDSKRFNIYAGSILGGLLLFLLLNFFSNLLYYGPEHAGHEEEVLAFAIPVEEEGAAQEEPEEVNLAALAAEADPSAGEKVFNKCKACHSVEQGKQGVGPSLYDVVGADIAANEGFSYSEALSSLEGDWTLEKMAAFIENPSGYAPGTKMAFAGLPDPEDRVDVIAYLNQTGGTPVELAPEQTAAAEQAGEQPVEGEQAAEGEQTAGQEQAAVEGEPTASELTGPLEEEPTPELEAGAVPEDLEPAEEQQAQAGQATEAEQAAGGGAGEYADLLANASAENGEKIYRRCQACHTLEEGKHRVGPSLHGVIGSDIGSAEGFNYSDAMASFEGDWTLENLMSYLENPKEFIPGNKMTFPGLRDAQDRIDVFAYIDQSDGERDLPQPGAAAGAPAQEPAQEGEQQGAAQGEEAQQQAEAQQEEPAQEQAQQEQAQQEQAQQEQAQQEQPAAAGGGGAFADLLAQASAEEGEKVFRRCQACHTLEEGKHRVGPSLHGVVGSDIGSAEGFNYSDAMTEFEGDWTLENLMAYLENPREFMPGNKMSFPGLRDAEDRINVLTYIDQSDGERDLPQ